MLGLEGGTDTLSDGPGLFGAGLRQDHRELLAPVTVSGVVGPQAGFQDLAETHQHLSPSRWPKASLKSLKRSMSISSRARGCL